MGDYAWPVALQAYSLREDAAKDFLGTLAAIGKMGYDGVEFAGFFGRTAKEVAKAAADAGLGIAGAHVGMAELTKDKIDATADFHEELGNRFVVVPALPEEYRGDRDTWRRTADVLNDIHRKLSERGMRSGYHSHGFDFLPVQGATAEEPTGWDVIGKNTDPGFVMQLDVGNVIYTGHGLDPVDFFDRYPGRAGTIHFKECKDGRLDVPFGKGDVPWADLFARMKKAGGTEWAVIEVEAYWRPAAECAKEDLDLLRTLYADA